MSACGACGATGMIGDLCRCHGLTHPDVLPDASRRVSTISEIIPELGTMPEWAEKAFEEGRFFHVALARVAGLEQRVTEVTHYAWLFAAALVVLVAGTVYHVLTAHPL